MRQYDEPVEVQRRDDVPTGFLWRGRLYVVRDVLGTWVETLPWWRAPSARAVYGLDGDGEGSVGAGGATTATGGPDPGEREMWRVEASAGRAAGWGVFELGFDWGTGGWTLLRVLD
ncbi:MAG: DUF6504 family protein [Actinomycetota bacterium]|nr:DUF6504 family protein [Actinomycetota bacterium]